MTNAMYMGSNALHAVNAHYIVPVILYIVLAPFIGLFIGYIITIIIKYLSR